MCMVQCNLRSYLIDVSIEQISVGRVVPLSIILMIAPSNSCINAQGLHIVGSLRFK